MFLNSLNTYRALAILLIVAPHIFFVSDIDLDSVVGQTVYNFFTGSTANFVFISGFLFYHVFYKKGRVNTFFSSKIKRLLIPYTFFSLLPIILKILWEPDYWDNYLRLDNQGILNNYVLPFLAYFLSGDHMIAYWYIPFAMLLFALYPLHKMYVEQRLNVQLLILIVLYIAALFVHRPLAGKLSALHYLVYYSPIYLLGILCSQNKEVLYKTFKGREIYFLVPAIVLMILPAFNGTTGSSYKPFFEYNGIDLLYLQKTLFCFFFMIWLHRFEHYNNRYVNLVAATSFVIYFVHGYFIQILLRLKIYFQVSFSHPWETFVVILFCFIIFGVLFAIVVKKLFPKYSQYITGY